MKLFFKIIGVIALIIIILIIICAILVSVLIKPDRVKQSLSRVVSEKTGRSLHIDKLSWSLFPTAHIRLGGIDLSNPVSIPGKFIHVDHVSMGVKLLPLLTGKIKTTKITINGVQLDLIENHQGRNNWTDLAHHQKAAAVTVKQTVKSTPIANNTTHADDQYDFEVPEVAINDINLHYNNEKTGQKIDLNNISFNAKDIAKGVTFPFALNVDMQQKKPPMKARVKIKGKLNFDQDQIQVIDTNFLSNISHDGRTQKILLQKINATLTAKQNIIALKPFSADLYGGTLKGAADANTNNSSYQLHMNLKNVSAKDLLTNLYQFKQFSGNMNSNFSLNTQGNNGAELTRQLHGQAQFDFQNGQLAGTDIAYMARKALSLVNHSIKVPDNQHMTKFGHMTGQMQINQGVAHTQVNLTSPVLQANGSGPIDLNTKHLKLKCLATLMQGSLSDPKPIEPSIPFKISGAFSHLSFQPDTSAIIKTLGEQQLKKQLHGQLKHLGGKTLGNLLGNL
jgi:uncharacterized protein involved in outer membrane biogenesis